MQQEAEIFYCSNFIHAHCVLDNSKIFKSFFAACFEDMQARFRSLTVWNLTKVIYDLVVAICWSSAVYI